MNRTLLYSGLFCTLMMVAAMASAQPRSWADLDYAGDGLVGHRLDISLPPAPQEGPFPVVIAMYGSGWANNNGKAEVQSSGMMAALHEAGFAVVAINHRSSADAVFPAQLHDVKAAIRFVRAQAAAYQLDPAFIGITGWSSGGHLAALAGATGTVRKKTAGLTTLLLDGDLGDWTSTSSEVNAVVDWYGPSDFSTLNRCPKEYDHEAPGSTVSRLLGVTPLDHPELCALAAPKTYLHAGSPAYLLIHGDADRRVPLCQSQELHDALQSAGVTSRLVVAAGGQHGPGVLEKAYFGEMTTFFRQQYGRAKYFERVDYTLKNDYGWLGRFAAENEALPAPKPGEQRVVFMGNSITEGWSNYHPAFFEENPYIERGIGGQTTPQMLVRFRQDVIDLKPAAVVILAGTNDIAGNTGPMTIEQTFSNLASMAELAEAHGIRVVLCAVLPVYDYPWKPGLEPAPKIRRLNGMIEAYCREKGFVYVDYFNAMRDERDGLQEPLGYDGVHPNKAGYDVMEPLVQEGIKRALGR